MSDLNLETAMQLWQRKYEYAEIYAYKDRAVFSNWTTKAPPIVYPNQNVSELVGQLSDEGWRCISFIHKQPANENDWYVYATLQFERTAVDISKLMALVQSEIDRVIKSSADETASAVAADGVIKPIL